MFSKSVVLLEGEKSDTFKIEQGMAQGCSLSPILFSVFVNDLLKVVEQTGLRIQLSSGKIDGGMLWGVISAKSAFSLWTSKPTFGSTFFMVIFLFERQFQI